MWLPKIEQRYIAAGKITAYMLNIDHADGAPKARFFIGVGFSLTSPETLRAALLDHPARLRSARPSSRPGG